MGDLHRFVYNGRHLVLDVESNALHEFSPAAWQALELLERGMDEAAVSRRLAPVFGLEEITGALGEINYLRKEGLLWSGEQPREEGATPYIKALCIFATDRCNLRCRYCFARKEGNPPRGRQAVMSVETGKAAIDFLLEASGPRRRCEVDYFGGEPLLNWQTVREITAYAREKSAACHKEIAFTLTTNGLLLTPEVAAYLAEESFAAVLSLDGRPAVQNAMRPRYDGGGSYAATVKRLQDYAKGNPRGGYYIRGTYTRHNMDFVDDVKHIYRLGFRRISMEPVVAPPEAEYALREEDLPRLEREYDALVEFYLECLEAGDPFSFFHFEIDLEQGPCLAKRLSGCGAGREYLAVAADGSLYPCHQLAGIPEMKMGHVQQPEGFNPALPGGFVPAGPRQEPCLRCWARYHCGGGCRAASYLNGTPAQPYPLECALQRKRLECALYLQAVKGGAGKAHGPG